MHRAGRSPGRLERELASADGGVALSAFAPDGVLTPDNFERALNAAVSTASPVRVPAGVWPMAGSLHIKGRGYTPMPVLIGEGRDVTILEWPDAFTGVCVDLDGSGGHFTGGGLVGIGIRTANGYGRGVGVRFSNLLFSKFIDVNVSGFCDRRNDGWERGVGVWGLGNYGDIGNSQNVLWDNVVVSGCTTGARLAGCTQFSLYHVQFNQNHGFADLIIEGTWSDIGIFGGMFQSQNDATDEITNTYKNHDFCCIRTVGGVSDGVHPYAAAGLNASISGASGGLVVITSLSGFSPSDVGSYLYFRDAIGPANQGIFEIAEYVSPNSVKVVKKNGTPENGLNWEKYTPCGAVTINIHGPVYHEGTAAAFVRTSAPKTDAVNIFMDGISINNADLLADLNGTHTCEIRGVSGFLNGPARVRARQVEELHITGGPPITDTTAYDLDSYSAQRATVNGQTRLAGRSGLTNVLAPACSEIYDMRDVSVVNGYVERVTGVLNGSVMVGHAVWLPKHARLGGRPAVGTRAAGNRTLSGPLAQGVPAGSRPGLFAIVHLPAGRSPAGASRRGVRLSGPLSSLEISIDDNVVSGPGRINGFYSVFGVGNFAADTVLSHRSMAVLVQERGYGGGHAMVVNGSVTNQINTSTGLVGALTNVVLGVADLDIAYLAVLKRPLTLEEEAAAFAAAAAFLKDTTAGVITPFSGTFTVESVVSGAPIPVSLASTNAVASLPAGHQAGDKVTFIVTTPASSRTLTIKPAGAETVNGAPTLVLSTDYAAATLWSDGVNWWRVS